MMKLDREKVFQVFCVLAAHRQDVKTHELVNRAQCIARALGYYDEEEVAKLEGDKESAAAWQDFTRNLTVRTLHCLRDEGVDSLDKLLKMNRRALMKIPNMGKKSVNELAETLAAHGKYLPGEHPTENL